MVAPRQNGTRSAPTPAKRTHRQLRSEREGWSALVSSESRGEQNLLKGGAWQILVPKRREEGGGGQACRSNGGRKGGWTRWSPGPKDGGGGRPGSGSHGGGGVRYGEMAHGLARKENRVGPTQEEI
jgi:hypothetical protein